MDRSRVLPPCVFTICVRHLALHRFVTCPSSLRSRSYCSPVLVFCKMSTLGLRLCGSVSETSRRTFDAVPRCQCAFPDRRNRRKCVPFGSKLFLNKVTRFFAQHPFFNVEILHVELPLVENLHVEVLHVALQVGLPLVEVQRNFVQLDGVIFLFFNQILQRNLELVHLNDVSLDDVVFLLFDEVLFQHKNKVLYLVMLSRSLKIVSVRFFVISNRSASLPLHRNCTKFCCHSFDHLFRQSVVLRVVCFHVLSGLVNVLQVVGQLLAFPPTDFDLRPRSRIFQLFHDEVLTQLTLELRLLGPRADRLPGVPIPLFDFRTRLAGTS